MPTAAVMSCVQSKPLNKNEMGSLLLSEKAFSPIDVIDWASETHTSEVHPLNASLPMLSSFESVVVSCNASGPGETGPTVSVVELAAGSNVCGKMI